MLYLIAFQISAGLCILLAILKALNTLSDKIVKNTEDYAVIISNHQYDRVKKENDTAIAILNQQNQMN